MVSIVTNDRLLHAAQPVWQGWHEQHHLASTITTSFKKPNIASAQSFVLGAALLRLFLSIIQSLPLILSRTYVQVSEDSTRLLRQDKSRRRHNPYKGDGKTVLFKSRPLYKYELLEMATTIRILALRPRTGNDELEGNLVLAEYSDFSNGFVSTFIPKIMRGTL